MYSQFALNGTEKWMTKIHHHPWFVQKRIIARLVPKVPVWPSAFVNFMFLVFLAKIKTAKRFWSENPSKGLPSEASKRLKIAVVASSDVL